MDNYLDSIQSSIIQKALIMFHWITEYIDIAYKKCKITYSAVLDAHKDEKWIFMDPNTIPLQIKYEREPNCYSVYIPSEYKFISGTEGGRPRKFHVVLAHIDGGNDNNIDVTEIFHRVSWNPGAAPSLFEMVILHGLYEKTPYRLMDIKTWKLNVMDDNGDEHIIDLNSEIAMERFRGF